MTWRPYLDAVDADDRPLCDRVHRLVMEVRPEARMVLSYTMSTYVVGTRQLHVGLEARALVLRLGRTTRTVVSSLAIRTSTVARAR